MDIAAAKFSRKRRPPPAATASSRGGSRFPRPVKFNDMDFGFNLAWELDFWGRFRRADAGRRAQFNASWTTTTPCWSPCWATRHGTSHHAADQERIELAKENVKLQTRGPEDRPGPLHAGSRRRIGRRPGAKHALADRGPIPAFEITLRQSQDHSALCWAFRPPTCKPAWDRARFPTAPSDVAVGIPAQLLERRPDVRSAERAAAAQSEQIGIAQADCVSPHLDHRHAGLLGPERLAVVHLPRTQRQRRPVLPVEHPQLRPDRQQRPLAGRQVPAELAGLPHRRCSPPTRRPRTDWSPTCKTQERDETARRRRCRRQQGLPDRRQPVSRRHGRLQPPRTIETNLVPQQDLQAQARGQIALGLIQVYRALGGGWEYRLGPGCNLAIAAAGGSSDGKRECAHSSPQRRSSTRCQWPRSRLPPLAGMPPAVKSLEFPSPLLEIRR